MYQPRLVQQTKRIEQLLRKDPNQRRTQSTELILLDELVEVDTQQLKDQTQMLLVNESILQSQNMMIVMLIKLTVKLRLISNHSFTAEKRVSYQVKNRHFHHALIEVCRFVLDNLHGHHLLRLQILALDDLAKRALPKHIQNQVPIPITHQ